MFDSSFELFLGCESEIIDMVKASIDAVVCSHLVA